MKKSENNNFKFYFFHFVYFNQISDDDIKMRELYEDQIDDKR